MRDDLSLESDDLGRPSGKKLPPDAFDALIDAERATLAQNGKRVNKIPLIKAVREATGLGLKDAKDAVEGYMVRRGGLNPPEPLANRPVGWIDDLLDAERAAASKEDRPINKILLIKTLREASGLGLAQAKLAVEDYLSRKGGEGLPSGSDRRAWLIILVIFVIAAIYLSNLFH